MKLKIRADAKDWLIFGLFCILVLYITAIGVLNLSEFSKYIASKTIGAVYLFFILVYHYFQYFQVVI